MHKDITQKHIEDLIIRFLQKEVSEDEIQILEAWLKEDADHLKQFDEINQTFQTAISMGRFSNPKIDNAWQKLSGRIDHENRTKLLVPSFSKTSAWRIAASFVFILSAAIGIWKYAANRSELPDWKRALVQTDTGKKTLLILPDSTTVWLNINSTLEYDSDFGESSRNVFLKGEAFFDVKKDKKDFVVATDNFSIQVKGTKFNVTTVNSDGNEKTTLEEGHIILKVKGLQKTYDMKPGDQVTFEKASNNVMLKQVDPSNYSAWKEVVLEFENEPLNTIVSKLENRFKVRIEIDSLISVRENLTMTIKDESLGEVLELIRLSSSLKYKMSDDKVIIFE